MGSWVLALALFITLGYLTWALFRGERAPANPWASAGYEWMTSSPPPPENFEGTPAFVRDPYDYTVPPELLGTGEPAEEARDG